MNTNDPNKTVIGAPPVDPNRTVLGGPNANRTQAMTAPPTMGDPNRTTAWSPEKPLSFTLTPSRTATMANGPAREQFLLEIQAPTTPSLPGVSTSGPRAPLNLCLVLDRSGSMEGAPLEYAKQACNQLVDLLAPTDILSIVVFDEIVEVLMPPQRCTDKMAIKAGIAQIQPGYTTNIHDGMTLASQQLASMMGESGRVTRMVVLTDGEPTAGIKEFAPLVQHAGNIKQQGITITYLGFGPEYNEELLAAMAKKAGGNYYFIPEPHLIPEIFRDELGKMMATASTGLQLSVKLARWTVLKGCTGLSTVSGETEFTIDLADVEQGSTIQVVLDLEFPNHPLGHYRVAEGKLKYTSLQGNTEVVPVDFVMEFTAEQARFMAPPDPRVAAAAEISAASRVVERTIMGLKTQAITTAQAMSELQKTQALLVQDGRMKDAQEVTMAMQAIQRGDSGTAEKTLMGTMLSLDQGKK